VYCENNGGWKKMFVPPLLVLIAIDHRINLLFPATYKAGTLVTTVRFNDAVVVVLVSENVNKLFVSIK
jgi:hypothetical protein